ncbi:MAG: NYN domain-containing protein [Candidatus Peregrinibacteria bacterium]
MKNSFFLIDGFNVYHHLLKLFPRKKHVYFDILPFLQQFFKERILPHHIFFFTAYTVWDKEKEARHKEYVKFLRNKGIQIVQGRFKKVTRNFQKNNMQVLFPEGFLPDENFPPKIVFENHEEKETDVNIAVKMLECAFLKGAEKIFLLSGDSDLVPAVQSVKKEKKEIFITNISTTAKEKYSKLSEVCDARKELLKDELEPFLFEFFEGEK